MLPFRCSHLQIKLANHKAHLSYDMTDMICWLVCVRLCIWQQQRERGKNLCHESSRKSFGLRLKSHYNKQKIILLWVYRPKLWERKFESRQLTPSCLLHYMTLSLSPFLPILSISFPAAHFITQISISRVVFYVCAISWGEIVVVRM